MAEYDESGNLLDETPGLGFASSPSTSLMTPNLGLASSPNTGLMTPDIAAPAGDESTWMDQASGLNFTASTAPSSDLGLSAPAARPQSDQEYLQSLPTSQKIGLALQAFSAGVAGRESPIERLLERKHRQDKENRADLLNTINVISKGTEILRKMPPGIARDAVARQLGKAVGGGEIAKVFEVAGDAQQEVKSVLDTFSDPDVQGQLLKVCSGSQDFRACVLTQARDKDFMDRAHAQADSKRMPDITRKLSAVTDQLGKTGVLDEYKTADGKFEVPFAKLLELNAKAKIFSPQEVDTIRRNEDMLQPFGIKTTAALKAGAAERAKQAERPTKEDFKEGQTRRIFDPQGTELQQEFKGGQWTTIGKRTKDAKEAKPLTLAQERHDEQVQQARDYLAERGIKKIEDVKKYSDKEVLKNPKGSLYGETIANPNYDPEAMRKWRLAGEPMFADTKAKRDAARGKPEPAAKPSAKETPKPSGAQLSTGDRQKIIAEATAAVNKGADPEAVKKRLKEKFGIEVTFTTADTLQAPKPSGAQLSAGDRQKIVDKVNAEIAKGVDPAAAAAWAKKKYGLDLKFEKRK